MEVDYLIAGQGLAGTALAWHLLERGARVLVVDREEGATSSRVAAGIMTPITGMNFVKSWRIDELWPYGKAYYRRLEEKLGASFFHETPIVRLFRSEADAALWSKRLAKNRDDYGLFLGGEDPGFESGEIHAPFGGFAMRNCGYVDVRRYLEASRDFFAGGKCYRCGEFDLENFDPAAGKLQWDGVRVAKAVISCVGHVAAASRFFDWVPFKSAKGEILTVAIEGVSRERILNRRNWLLPLGDGVFRTGTTYEWTQLDTQPTAAAREEIEANLRAFLPEGEGYRVLEHEAAVRPIVEGSKVLMGRHPAHSRLCLFNGLGSKGVLNSPFFANQFAAHLEDGAPIEGEVDLRKNL